MTHDRLLGIVSQLLGSEDVVVNGNHRLRPKLPSKDDVFVIPWHQDAAFFHPSADPRPSASDWSEQPPIITAWVPFVDVDEDTGCLQMLRSKSESAGAGAGGSELHELRPHYIAEISDPNRPEVESSAQSTSIHPDHLPSVAEQEEEQFEARSCPVAAGDVVFFTSLAVHRSLPNRSDVVRWSADIRYQVPAAGNCFPREPSFLAKTASTTATAAAAAAAGAGAGAGAGAAATATATATATTDGGLEYIPGGAGAEAEAEAAAGAGGAGADAGWRRWVALRSNHVVEKIRPGSSIEIGTDRPWRPARGEVYRMPMVQHPLEGDIEYQGRLRAVEKQRREEEEAEEAARLRRLLLRQKEQQRTAAKM